MPMPGNNKAAILAERVGFKIVGLDAAIVGAVDDTTLRFSGAPAFTGPDGASYFAITTTANNGTQIRFTRRGKYLVHANVRCLGQAGATLCLAGISVDASAAEAAADPSATVAAVRDAGATGQAAGVLAASSIKLVATIQVTQAMLNAGQGVVRIQASDGANATPGAQVVLTETYVACERVDDCVGGT
jgi:hypothetical protein